MKKIFTNIIPRFLRNLRIPYRAAMLALVLLTVGDVTQAAVTIRIIEENGDVFVKSSGVFDTTGMSSSTGTIYASQYIVPTMANISSIVSVIPGTGYFFLDGKHPLNFGSGNQTPATSGSGANIYLAGGIVSFPSGTNPYSMDFVLSFEGNTLINLGVTPGTYIWTNTATNPNDTITLLIGYTVGGSVSGLNGSVVLQNNGGNDLTLDSNGSFTFTNPITPNSSYVVTVKTQPTGQTCTVSSGDGMVAEENVTDVAVVCTPNTHTIGGSVSGLNGSVVLQNNGGDNLTVSSNGPFTFTTALNYGSSYAVTVLTQPMGQTCSVSNGTGTANANVTNIAISCIDNPPPTPTNVQATAGVRSITVTFTTVTPSSKSTSLLNSSITFTANCISTNGGVSGTATGTSSPLIVTGVTPGKSYTCTVSATGAGGTSTSAPSNVVIPLDDPTPIPTLAEWAKILLALSMIGMARWYWMRRVS